MLSTSTPAWKAEAEGVQSFRGDVFRTRRSERGELVDEICCGGSSERDGENALRFDALFEQSRNTAHKYPAVLIFEMRFSADSTVASK
jgi:hypothetical protein